jgi:hypothetical protein
MDTYKVKRDYLLRQKNGVNNMSTVNNSSLPMSIKKLHHHLPILGKLA